jgi:hypothetical protein
VAFWSFVEKSSELPFPYELYFTDRTISLFRADDFRLPLILFGSFASVIVAFTVHEHNDVGILLDRPRFSKVAQLRFVVLAIFRLSIELRQA